MKPRKKITDETLLKQACIKLLKYCLIPTWPIVAGPMSPPGLPDRFGLLPGAQCPHCGQRARALALEFKAKRRPLTPHQELFREVWEGNGGIHVTVYSPDDLKRELNLKVLL